MKKENEMSRKPIIKEDMEVIEKISEAIGEPLKELGPDNFFQAGKEGYEMKTGYLPGENGRISGLSLNKTRTPPSSLLSKLDGLVQFITYDMLLEDLSFFRSLEGLTHLSLVRSNLTDVSFLGELKGLTTLDLSGNKLTDVSFLGELKGLTTLDLIGNELTDVSFLGELKGLTKLYLSGNKLTDVSFLGELKGLTKLYLSGNKLTDVSFLGELKGLTTLDLGINKLTDVSFLGELKGLTTLDLSGNNLTDVSFLKYLKNLKIVFLEGNPLEKPPKEIIATYSGERIRSYFKALEGENRCLQEVKVLLVGDGGAGKTSLLKRLNNEEFNKNEPQTHGINIIDLSKTIAKKARVHIWDFGGQEIMHATHQFFLSKRSLYILVTDCRKNDNVEHWLNHIDSFGGDSPVMIVINKIDENPSFDLNRGDLLKKYPNIRGFYKLSCSTLKGLDHFITDMMTHIQSVEYMKELWPKTWFDIKTELENMKDNYITMDRFDNICRINNVTDRIERSTILEYLHNLGVILHFKQFDLKEYQVLEPHWVTEAVYKIINSKSLAESCGYLKKDKIDQILHHETFNRDEYQTSLKRKKYSPMEQGYILALMKKFQLCYSRDDGTVLVPDLLIVRQPSEAEAAEFTSEKPLRFLYRFGFLPPGVIPRFIVKVNTHLASPKLQWRTGVILESKKLGVRALVRADKETQEIDVRVSGNKTGRGEYMSYIRQILQTIFNSYKKIDFTEHVPLPDQLEPGKDILVEYKDLLGLREMGIDKYIKGELKKSYSVSSLLTGLETQVKKKSEGLFHPERSNEIHFSPEINMSPVFYIDNKAIARATAKATAQVKVINQLSADIKREFVFLSPALKKACPDLDDFLDDLEKNLETLEPDKNTEELSTPLKKLGYFLESLGLNDSQYGPVIKKTDKLLRGAKKLGKAYNAIREYIPAPLPKVPEFLLK